MEDLVYILIQEFEEQSLITKEELFEKYAMDKKQIANFNKIYNKLFEQ